MKLKSIGTMKTPNSDEIAANAAEFKRRLGSKAMRSVNIIEYSMKILYKTIIL